MFRQDKYDGKTLLTGVASSGFRTTINQFEMATNGNDESNRTGSTTLSAFVTVPDTQFLRYSIISG